MVRDLPANDEPSVYSAPRLIGPIAPCATERSDRESLAAERHCDERHCDNSQRLAIE